MNNNGYTPPSAEVDYSSLKINIIAAIGVAAALGVSYFSSIFFDDITAGSPLIYAALSAGVFLTAVFLQSIFRKDMFRVSTMAFIETAALGAFFMQHILQFVFLGGVLCFLFLMWASWNGKRELVNTVKIRIFGVAGAILPKAVTALCIFLAAAYVSGFEYRGTLITKDAFIELTLAADPIVNYFYPGVRLESTFNEAARVIAEDQLKGNVAYDSLKPADKEAFLARSTQEFEKRIEDKYLKTDIDPNSKLIDIFYKAFSDYVLTVPSERKLTVMAIVALVVFLILRGFGTPFYWLVAFVGAFIYQVCVALGFAIIAAETRSKEIVVLK